MNPAPFPTTHVSLVKLAAQPRAAGFRDAWGRFFGGYWKPLYAFLVRTGSAPEDALDLLQDFFLEGASGSVLRGYDPDRGRLRTYLLACLKNVRRKAWRRQKRRPDRWTFADLKAAPAVREPVARDPEALFELEWTRRLAERTIEAIRSRLTGEATGLALLDRWVLARERPRAEGLAQELGITARALYTRATRLRHALVKEAESQARLVADRPEHWQAERDEVLRVLRGEGTA